MLRRAQLLALAFAACAAGARAQARCEPGLGPFWKEWRCAQGSVRILETRLPLKPFFHAHSPTTLRRLSRQSPGAVLYVNGSFHNGNYAKPTWEGWVLSDTGRLLSPLKPDDAQLTHVLTLNERGQIASIQAASDFSTPPVGQTKSGWRIQSGPLVIDRGDPAAPLIQKSLNGSDAYKRTAIGMTHDGATVIVIATRPIRLLDLAKTVLQAGDLSQRGLSLLNLDGGPSTAVYSSRSKAWRYGADKITPLGFALLRP